MVFVYHNWQVDLYLWFDEFWSCAFWTDITWIRADELASKCLVVVNTRIVKWIMLIVEYIGLVMFAAECVVSRTASQNFACNFVTRVPPWYDPLPLTGCLVSTVSQSFSVFCRGGVFVHCSAVCVTEVLGTVVCVTKVFRSCCLCAGSTTRNVFFFSVCVLEVPHVTCCLCISSSACNMCTVVCVPQDVLENDEIKLDWMFRYSIMQDIVRVSSPFFLLPLPPPQKKKKKIWWDCGERIERIQYNWKVQVPSERWSPCVCVWARVHAPVDA